MILVQITQEHHLEQIHRSTHFNWGQRLSVDEYIEREQVLEMQEYHSTRWGLVDDKNELVCCLEAYHVDCAFNPNQSDLSPRLGKCVSIASVFTFIQHRNKGFMKQLLLAVKKEYHSLGFLCSILYSDIGTRYYSKLKWLIHPSKTWSFPSTPTIVIPTLVEYLKINDSDIANLLNHASTNSIQSLKHLEFFVIPTAEMNAWFQARSTFYAKTLYNKTLETCGAKIEWDFVTWFHDFKQELLVITFTFVNSQMNAINLFQAAKMEANRYGFKRVIVWDLTLQLQNWVGVMDGIRFEERSDSLSSLMILDDSTPVQPVVWIHNEKYAWC